MKNINPVRSFIWYSLPFIVRNLFPLLSIPIITNYLSVYDFGLYALALVYGTLVTGISNLGLLAIYERTFFEIEKSNRNNLLFSNVVFVFATLFIFLLLTLEFNSFIGNKIFLNGDISNFLFITVLCLGIKSLNQYFFYSLKNAEKPILYSFITVSEILLSFGLSIFLLIKYQDLKCFLIGQTIGVSIIFLTAFFILITNGGNKFDYKLIKNQLKLSLPLTPRIFFGMINSQFDRYMLGIMGSISGVGIFDISQKIAFSTYSFMTMLQNIFSPKVYKYFFSKKTYSDRIGSYLTPFFYLSMLFSLTIGLFAEEILIIFTPKEYHEASIYVTILVFQMIFYFFGKQPQLVFAKKTGLISLLSFSSIFLNIGLNFPLINAFGVSGAVYATFISGVLSSYLNFYFGQKFAPINYNKNFFIILIYTSFAFCFLIITSYLPMNNFLKLSFKISLMFGYLIIGFSFGYYRKVKLLLFELKTN